MTPGVAALVATVGIAGMAAMPAYAARLQVAPEAPPWMHLGADVLLWLHIGGGAAGIATGMVALASRKGGRIHRSVGKVFFVVMLVSYGLAACVAPFMHVEQRTNTLAGLMALYLLLSGWQAVQRKELKAGLFQFAGLAAVLSIAGVSATFTLLGSGSGTTGGPPEQVFVAFTAVGLIAAAGEINVLVRGSIKGPARLARHLWRMCLSLFIASGSFFLGQMQFQPDWLIESRLNILLALTPGVVMLVYLILVRLPKRRWQARTEPFGVAAE
jgi:uncharacterized membrane protein